ncbi:MAG: hypothetical protein OHK0022_37880 [Roseiflexaceae bacterium]
MNHLQRYLVDEFVEDYQEGHLSRRQALKLIAGITGATVAAQILAACGTQPTATNPTAAPTGAPTAGSEATSVPATSAPSATDAPAATSAATSAPAATTQAQSPDSVAADDPAVVAQMVTFPSGDGELMGYLARPTGEGQFPIVLVCHENRGLTPHIQDVTRRLAKSGYTALAVDLLSRQGGTASITDTDSIPGLLSGAPPERHVSDFTAGLNYVKTQPFAKADSVGMVGFCFGGGVTWLVAAGLPELKAAVPFYGPPVAASEIPKINAPVLAIYAERDNRINASIPTVEQAMQQNNKTYRKIIYPGVDHAFHNDTGQRYNREQAQAAWAETLAWFQQYLRGDSAG